MDDRCLPRVLAALSTALLAAACSALADANAQRTPMAQGQRCPVVTSSSSVPVYWVHQRDDPNAVRLVHDCVPAAGNEDVPTQSVRALLKGHSADPGLGSIWAISDPPEAEVSVTVTPNLISVNLPGTAIAIPPNVRLAATAVRLAVQQLVYTVTGAAGSDVPVEILVDGRRGAWMWGVTAHEPFTRAPASEVLDAPITTRLTDRREDVRPRVDVCDSDDW
jgi:hypothetical protein